MKTNEIRRQFLNYFKKNKHDIVKSSSLIPVNDPTLLFTNAGMVQFKDLFLGEALRPYTRAASSQRCVRAGGKHNDLDNVGYTARHHTFFEMLGNFSFGDYFKKEAIEYAWRLLTEGFNIPEARLWITVFNDDKEAENIWLNHIKINPKVFSRRSEKNNFWMMGDTGPCGPCTEIFYDHGPEIPGGPPESENEDSDRFVEIWNLVFMQYNRTADGNMTLLSQPSVDTGMGLERIAAVLQGVHSNYDIDLFRNLINACINLNAIENKESNSLKVVADHIRSSAFLIADGVTPSNEGRGYVLRRIIRRALRHGHKLGLKEPFFYRLVDPLAKEMGEAFPELVGAKTRIKNTLKREEEKFATTLDQGMKVFEDEVGDLTKKLLPGDVIFKLYDTFGFPPDLTADIARERGINVDYKGFEALMMQQRERSQTASQFGVDYNVEYHIEGETEFTGYDHVSDTGKIFALLNEKGEPANVLHAGEKGTVILDRTPFYAESGGQVGDKGQLIHENGSFTVFDTKKQNMVYLHFGQLNKGELNIGDTLNTEVDSSRQAIMLNHTATHLLHAALKRSLGNEVIQKGSLVEASRLRFDFSYPHALTQAQIWGIERVVNQQIRANLHASIRRMTLDEALKKGASALFGEKYGSEVRVLNIGEFSMELCGGTHVDHTGEIGLFKITSETGIAAGIRRIEAVTAEAAYDLIEAMDKDLTQAAQVLKTDRDNMIEKVKQLTEKNKKHEKSLKHLQQKLATTLMPLPSSGTLPGRIKVPIKLNGVNLLIQSIEGFGLEILRMAVDGLKQQYKPAVILLATIIDNKVHLVAGVSDEMTDKVKAGELIQFVAEQIDGKGGGRADMAQGSGNNPEALPGALESVNDFVKEKIS